MQAPSLKPALSLVSLLCLFLILFLASCSGKLEFAAGTVASADAEQRQALPVPEHAVHTPAAIPWNQLGARVAEQNPDMAGSVEPVQGGARLTSPVQRLEGTVTLQGLSIESTAEGREGGFAMQAVALGRDNVMAPVSDGLDVVVDGPHARLIRADVTEEFSTSADGIRQDFLLHASPPGTGQVRLELALSGATVEPSPHGARIILTESGRALAYHRLLVLDAQDRELPARMDVASPTLLALVVDDTNAAYPIRIDPTFTDENWVSMGTSDDGVNGTVRALAIHGNTVYVGGEFTEAGGKPATYVAQWDGSKWSPVGSGMNGVVRALVVDADGSLYAGGEFTEAGGNTANRIAKWKDDEWSALGTGGNNGVNGTVRTLAVFGTTVFVGGDFAQAGGASYTRHIAKWDGTDWSALGSGTNENGYVYALAVDKFGKLFAGGGFAKACNEQPCDWDTQAITVDQIAMWDATGWSRMGNDTYPGITGTAVYALAEDNGNLYIGGSFSQVAGVSASNIAKWDGSWSRLGPDDYPGMDAAVNELILDPDGNLYAGGFFTTAGGMSAEKVAQWNGTAWNPLGFQMNNFVEALAVDTAGNVYAGGNITQADLNSVNRFAKWNADQESWSPVASGLNGPVFTFAFSGNDVYVGGEFTHVAGILVNNIAKWEENTNTWSALGEGVDEAVHGLAYHSGNLYVGGLFTSAGGDENIKYIAKWDENTHTWSPLGGGVDQAVNALAIDSSGNLYAGGDFTEAGGNGANRIAMWNGSAWSALGGGVDAEVNALAFDPHEGFLYAGGDFAQAGGVTVNHVAGWSGSTWFALDQGLNNRVFTLAIGESGNVYVGGLFTDVFQVSSSPLNRVAVASIDGWTSGKPDFSWGQLGSGVQDPVSTWVNALAIDSAGNLYAGGRFTEAGDDPAHYIAKWNGSAWSALGSGLGPADTWVIGLAFHDNKLYAGGSFEIAGDKDSHYLAYTNLPAGGGEGALQVTIEPEGARTAGAQWRRTGTETWYNSGDTETDLPAGGHVVEFKAINGWFKPAEAHLTITSGSTTQITGTYTQYQPFPDTGQARCYNNSVEITCPSPGQPFYGQDAQYQPRLPRSYTKLGHGGTILADDALHVDNGGPWIMTRDNVTGLIWEVKTDANKNGTYTWQNAQDGFIAGLNSAEFGGFTDWRMPSIEELSSLVNAGVINPSIDPLYFPNSVVSNYWSSTTCASNTHYAWRIYFYAGLVSYNLKSNSSYVRAVRAGQPRSFDDLVIHGDGTFSDPTTGLMWQLETAPGTYTWQEALDYGQNLTLAGYSDWRLPNRNELHSLVDYSRDDPSIAPVLQGHTESFNYWSSTTSAGDTPGAWLVNFNDGGVSHGGKSSSYYVRAVRSGQSGSFGNLAITIEPEGARTARAQWRRVGTSTWRDSGTTESGVPASGHIVEYKEISGWTAPANQNVTITDGETTAATGTYTPSASPGSLKWRIRVNQAVADPYVRSSPALSTDGSVAYFGSNDGKVYAVNTADGTKKWERETGGPVRSTPAVDASGYVYVGSNDQSFYKLDPSDGSDVTVEASWPITTGGHIWSSPAVGSDGTVYFGVNDNILDAFHSNGEIKWAMNLGSEVMSSPAVHGDYVYVGTYDRDLHARHVNTGATKAGFPFQASWIIYSSPAIGADGTIYFATTDGNVYAVNPNGSQKWVRSLGETFVFSSPVLGEDHLYIGCNEGKLHKLDMHTGTPAGGNWPYQTGGPIMSTPALGGMHDPYESIIYVGSYDGKLHAVNPNGTPVGGNWPHQTGGPIYASPTIGPGPEYTVYVGSHDGYFYAIQGEYPLAVTAWPKFRRDVQNTGAVP